MTKNEFLKSELLLAVKSELNNYNFLLNKSNDEFTKKDEEGWSKYQLIFYEEMMDGK
jgi:hypothetical protein